MPWKRRIFKHEDVSGKKNEESILEKRENEIGGIREEIEERRKVNREK